jgi:hypothetical protein
MAEESGGWGETEQRYLRQQAEYQPSSVIYFVNATFPQGKADNSNTVNMASP